MISDSSQELHQKPLVVPTTKGLHAFFRVPKNITPRLTGERQRFSKLIIPLEYISRDYYAISGVNNRVLTPVDAITWALPFLPDTIWPAHKGCKSPVNLRDLIVVGTRFNNIREDATNSLYMLTSPIVDWGHTYLCLRDYAGEGLRSEELEYLREEARKMAIKQRKGKVAKYTKLVVLESMCDLELATATNDEKRIVSWIS